MATCLEDRCRDYQELRDQAAGFLKPGKDAGYYPETRDILRSICQNARGDE